MSLWNRFDHTLVPLLIRCELHFSNIVQLHKSATFWWRCLFFKCMLIVFFCAPTPPHPTHAILPHPIPPHTPPLPPPLPHTTTRHTLENASISTQVVPSVSNVPHGCSVEGSYIAASVGQCPKKVMMSAIARSVAQTRQPTKPTKPMQPMLTSKPLPPRPPTKPRPPTPRTPMLTSKPLPPRPPTKPMPPTPRTEKGKQKSRNSSIEFAARHPHPMTPQSEICVDGPV